jgi:hypothetical protein
MLEIHLSMPSLLLEFTDLFIYFEKSAISLMGLPLYVIWHFSLQASNILSLFCMSNVLTVP